MTTVVHVNSEAWKRAVANGTAVYIGRAVPRRKFQASPWANPFKVNIKKPKDTTWAGIICLDLLCAVHGPNHVNTVLYDLWLQDKLPPYFEPPEPDRRQWILDHVHELKNKTLGCWRKKEGHEFCHGDVLKEMADAFFSNE